MLNRAGAGPLATFARAFKTASPPFVPRLFEARSKSVSPGIHASKSPTNLPPTDPKWFFGAASLVSLERLLTLLDMILAPSSPRALSPISRLCSFAGTGNALQSTSAPFAPILLPARSNSISAVSRCRPFAKADAPSSLSSARDTSRAVRRTREVNATPSARPPTVPNPLSLTDSLVNAESVEKPAITCDTALESSVSSFPEIRQLLLASRSVRLLLRGRRGETAAASSLRERSRTCTPPERSLQYSAWPFNDCNLGNLSNESDRDTHPAVPKRFPSKLKLRSSDNLVISPTKQLTPKHSKSLCERSRRVSADS
mmetsp:Transcript_22983/g.48173  ORF Transcript_22983/g.48173 Transcript_22983/m.48173 type:complete len:314 (-) Transcript_22983:1327-2268(-)